MGTVEKKLSELIKQEKKKLSNDACLKELEKSTKEFQKLIDDGIVKPRGYNLQTIEDSYNSSIQFNMSF
ncbi:hypothetical protein [uncultured Bacteroides sp.]|jgi:hypothetical protein|uniref:hypothetical protein n=1 Tax=uncultured Bacteroides sp. TaxID=162156 RepID=UPI00280C13FB|nr:hypothetical protein [uncultured Bacteroides sp.]